MLYDFFHCDGLEPQSEIKETIDSLTVVVTPARPMRAFVTKIFDELKTISSRDNFELFFDICGTNVKISDTSKSSFNILIAHIEDNDEIDDYEISLYLKKECKKSTLSVYFFDNLIGFLNKENINDVFSTISKYLDEKLFFEVFSNVDSFCSSGIAFYQSGYPLDDSYTDSSKKRDSQIEMFKESGNSPDLVCSLLPSDFYLTTASTSKSVNKLFSKATGVLSLIFISSASRFISNGNLSYKINGYKTVYCDEVSLEVVRNHNKLLHKIYSWAYEGGNRADKLGLVRNVLSIHLDTKGQVRFDDEAWEAIKSNYQIYLKDNIQSYLEVKNKIGEFIIDSTSRTYTMADELLASLKNNMLIVFTFIFSVVIVNGSKDYGFEAVFSNSYLAMVFIISIMSGIWMQMITIETRKRFGYASNSIKDILKLNYNKIIMESEINEIVDPVLEKNRLYLESQIKRYTKWWVLLLSAFVLCFLVANIVLKDQSKIIEEPVKVEAKSTQ